MEIQLKCKNCGGVYSIDTKTRRRIIYKCSSCGKELPVRKKPKEKETK